MPDQFHEPLARPAFHLEHHGFLQLPQPVVHEEKRHEDRRDADRHEPFIADVTGRMESQSFRRQLVVELLDERFERRALKPQPEFGNAALEKLLIVE